MVVTSARGGEPNGKNQVPDRVTQVAAFDRLVSSLKISLNAQNLSVRTVESYSDSMRDLQGLLVCQGMPLEPSVLARLRPGDQFWSSCLLVCRWPRVYVSGCRKPLDGMGLDQVKRYNGFLIDARKPQP